MAQLDLLQQSVDAARNGEENGWKLTFGAWLPSLLEESTAAVFFKELTASLVDNQ